MRKSDLAGFDGLPHTATAISDHWPAKRQCFDGYNSKILFPRKKEGATVRILFTKLRVRQRATETNGGTSKLPQTCVFLAFSDDMQFPAQVIARLNRQIHALIIH